MTAPRVDFYLLADADPRTRARVACQLAEKAFAKGQRVHLHCTDAAQTETLDKLLWTFRDKAFVPHGLSGCNEPVEIGHVEPTSGAAVLINLAEEVPGWFARYERVAEIVAGEESAKQTGRARFRVYRDRGCTPTTHDVGAAS
jgi:DNA polymerase-3 subunit chi